MDLVGTTEGHFSSGSTYGPDPGTKGQGSLVITRLVYLIDPDNAGNMDRHWWSPNENNPNFVAGTILPYCTKRSLLHTYCHTSFQRDKGGRTEGQRVVAAKGGEQGNDLGFCESSSFSGFAAGAPWHNSSLPASFPTEKLMLAPSHAARVQQASSCQFCKGS